MPVDASPDDVAVYGALLSPWVADPPEELTRRQLDELAGRRLTDEDLDALAATGVVEVLSSGRCRARPADLELGLQLARPRGPARDARARRAS